MTRKLFGTDGIRGRANSEPMTAETALKVGLAAAAQFTRGDHRHRVVIGKDTRLSGYMLEPALTAGFISMGMDVTLVGPIPTPGVAMLTRSLRADLGVMISASHNPFEDNGIKLFGPDGFKLSDEVEAAIEAKMDNGVSEHLADARELGRATRLEDAPGRYIEQVKQTFPKRHTLEGLKVCVDCANGAAYKVAPAVLFELGAEVVPLAVSPDGRNINHRCGSTDTELLQKRVVEEGADLGIALDGDADRVLICDETGQLIDGDQIMALIARDWVMRGELRAGAVVATVMSNLGLERFINELGIELVRTKVGDRYVVETMRRLGANFGGEQSGHLILGDHATTGDGLIAALQVLAVLVESARPASRLLKVFEPLPQVLENARYVAGSAPLEQQAVIDAIEAAHARLGAAGRLVIRPSGTEPVIRVMAEGEDEALVCRIVGELVTAIEASGSSGGRRRAAGA
jgi:phosphoglucosamine mutase